MANPEHLEILKQGVEVWNRWRTESLDILPDLKVASLRGLDLSGANFKRAELTGADLSNAHLIDADLSEANLIRAILSGALVTAAYLGRANLTDATLRHGSLQASDLTATTLIRADLSDADLSRAWFSEANLSDANLSSSFLGSTDFSRANLSGASLSRADLSHTNLAYANLQKANLANVDLWDVDLTGAEIGWTMFAGDDLRSVKGLDTIIHRGPSSIGIDTLYKSEGNLSEAFLRGCGVPDTFITFARSLVGAAIDYYSAFISYSSKNTDIAERLYADLQSKNVRCWFAPEDIKIGDKFRQRIDDAIRIHDKLLVVLSEQSISSAWVEEEVEAAIEREHREKRLVLFPVRIDDAVIESGQAWAAALRRMRHIGDFSKWKDHDSYSKAFERLLRDLKAE